MAQDNMSSKQIKDIVINTIKKTAEKSIQDADYDKTILATIQYCADATIGQYKIKYHNGYYTAYSKDTSTIYSNNAQVYVLVPGNDMNNRMFISGLASNDNKKKVSIRSLEGDQQYYKEGKNYITKIPNKTINMSTYDAVNKEWRKTIWSKSPDTPRSINVVNNINNLLSTATAIRIGATFQTSIEESRKYNGDYGLEFTFKYRSTSTKEFYYKVFRIDTFSMVGTPFSFTTPMPQYLYFNLPKEHSTEFVELYSIAEFVTSFPPYESLPEDKYDIKVSNISLHKAVKLYDSDEDKYKLAIMSEDNFDFGIKSSINCTAELRVDGNAVTDISQKVEYYWAKEDAAVDNVNHPKYNKYTGKGWYCLNKGSKVKYSNETIEDLTNYTITQDNTGTLSECIIWDTGSKDVTLKKTIFCGKKIKLKCVAFYENTIISSKEVEILNPDGYYLLLGSEDNKISSANGKGNFTLIAGVFKDVSINSNEETAPEEHSLDEAISYKWVEIDSLKNTKSLPSTDYVEVLTRMAGWSSSQDNETLTNEQVAEYLNRPENDGYEVCLERYEYYDEKFTELDNLENLTQEEKVQKTRCQTRRDYIVPTKLQKINQQYIDGYQNKKYYIFGPSRVQGKYNKSIDTNDYKSAEIDKVTKYFYGTDEYTEYATKQNTLYLLPANKIHGEATYKVTALRMINGVKQSIGTETITLIDSEQTTTRYELEIVNGNNTFMYDEAGHKPEHLLLPELSFKLYDNKNNHEVVYDSSLEDAGQTFNLTALAPVWTFYNNSNSLLNTKYIAGKPSTCKISLEDNRKNELSNAARFSYYLAAEFDENKRNSNNVTLRVKVGDEVVTSSTNFIFVKQGDLGTNGTDLVLNIKNQNYDQYKDSTLTKYNYIDGRIVSPDERHLKNTYMYATKCYDLNGNFVTDYRSSRCVNLHFIQGADNEYGFIDTNTIELWGQWIQNGQADNINGNTSDWNVEDCAKSNHKYRDYYGKSCYAKPPFTISTVSGTKYKATITIDEYGESGYALRPSRYPYTSEGPENVVVNNETYNYVVANNVVKVRAEKETLQGKVNDKIKRINYGYYKMPYFFFNYTRDESMPNMDAARHIVVTGGFDEVKYDSAGTNPEYNKKNPFCVYLFDENGKNITEEMLNGIPTSKTILQWTFSKGFESGNTITRETIGNIQNFENISSTKSLYHTYCKYNNKYYKCNTPHSKSQTIIIEGTNEKYDPETFVTPYWDEINIYSETDQKLSLRPSVSYETLAQTDLFNSWVSVYIRYEKSVNKVYQAEAFIPINVFCNKYGSQEINSWDGKKTIVDDAYMISSKIAAGVKTNDNKFRGVTIGTTFYPDNDDRKEEIGIFGYGLTHKDATNKWDPNSWARTLYIDSDTGRAIFGPSGATQIVLDPRIPEDNEEIWSRIAGWYVSPNYFYKGVISTEIPITNFDEYSQGGNITPPTDDTSGFLGSVGMYCPTQGQIQDSDVWLWADNSGEIDYSSFNKTNGNFAVTYGGHLYAKGVHVKGDIVAQSGRFEKGSASIDICPSRDDGDYLLWNSNFKVKSLPNNESAVYVKGTIMAKSGQIGSVSDTATGDDPGVLFIEYMWYPWHLPADNEDWNNNTMYLDRTAGTTKKYALYNKNFYVDNTGNAFFNGKLFTEAGRIGDWVIKRSDIRSTDGNVRLGPTRLVLGNFTAEASGALSGPSWRITSDGCAYFTNLGNEFTAAKFITAGGSTFDEHGLNLAEGERMGIGDTYLAAGSNGFILHGGISIEDPSTFSDTVTFNGSAYFGGSAGAITINNTGITCGGPSGRYKIYTSGNADLNTVTVQNLTIGDTNIENYIRNIVREMINSTTLAGTFNYRDQDWSGVRGTPQSVSVYIT